MGAIATGAAAVGALAIARLAVKRMVIGHLKIEELEVGRLRVRELEVEGAARPAPPARPLGPPGLAASSDKPHEVERLSGPGI